MESRNSVSPAISVFCCGMNMLMLPCVWPGVCMTWKSEPPSDRDVPSLALVSTSTFPGAEHPDPLRLYIEHRK